jgi:ABC-type cobalamin transport system ATPase subunit
LEDNLKALIKPQYVDHIPKAIKGSMTVSQMLDSKLELNNKQKMCDELELNHVLDREIVHLSGGELQRFAIAMSCIQKADVYVRPLFLLLIYANGRAGTCSTSPLRIWISSNVSRLLRLSEACLTQIAMSWP